MFFSRPIVGAVALTTVAAAVNQYQYVDPETGLVTSVQIEKSTGWGILDASCLKTFKRWRFKPHTVRKLHIPVIFTRR